MKTFSLSEDININLVFIDSFVLAQKYKYFLGLYAREGSLFTIDEDS